MSKGPPFLKLQLEGRLCVTLVTLGNTLSHQRLWMTQLLDRIVPAMEDAPAELARRGADILRRGGIPMGSQVRGTWEIP